MKITESKLRKLIREQTEGSGYMTVGDIRRKLDGVPDHAIVMASTSDGGTVPAWDDTVSDRLQGPAFLTDYGSLVWADDYNSREEMFEEEGDSLEEVIVGITLDTVNN
tara:strand:- start:2331 stop:2654 length:324 start_codon:yes stop_codon:yes gene_type:complete